ncbi:MULTISPECIES: LysR family transcriptional regulator [Rhizobium/Agrobacterium group]|nr:MULTISPECIES: LysR family transcriptional regulator [Rhizobium/Agrobacterium group]MDM7980859.1 LysR family transcriptional regulator [Rhizobium sp.]AOG10435.1 bacterial regulatory helix-turn-helix, lysR family protein [Agrobacterium sp. RAC06]KPF61280.1 LysR family transcriptional regulator [Rhizobium sp. AAP116]MDM8012499.1 LysR family transcriptional regulator [Rhizobium sp.]QGG91795.1 LysR family transcriptional regulator [Agrobacterium sp. MA01]
MSELNYHHLRYFRAVAHDGNLTRTAERLNLSQSALSTQIKQLEERLGHSLFERRGRQLYLTEAGRIALDHADTIFSAGEELVETLKETGRTRRAIRIGALATLSRNFQMEFLRPILGRSDVDMILRSGSTSELLGALETLNLDIVLLNQAPMADSVTPFIAQHVYQQRVSLIGKPSYGKPGAKLADLLAEHPVILPTLESGVRSQFEALVARLGITPQIAAEVDDMAMMRLLAREGAGLAVLPPIVVKGELEAGTLVEFDALPGMIESFFAVTVKRRFPNPLIRPLLEASEDGKTAGA